MPRRFQSGGGYTGYGTYPADAQEQVRPPLTPRYKQQQIAQKMVSSDYNQERSASSPIRNQDYDFHIGTADDVAEGDLIPPWKAKSNNSREMYVKRCAERSMLRRQGEMRPISVDVDENYGMHNVEDEQHASESPQLPPPPQPQSPPASTKSVSFNTRDKIHQWDDQLDELKHVDEVFFAAAKYLLEDVHNVANDYLEMEEKDFDLVQSFHGDPEGAAGKGGTVSDGIFAKLFQCGDLSGANESAKPYLGIDGEILDDGQVTHQPRKQFRLREKLLNDFQAALDYRLTKLDEDENGTIDDDIALQTREIARKIDAYGLPKLWRNECQEEEDPNGAKPSTGSLVVSYYGCFLQQNIDSDLTFNRSNCTRNRASSRKAHNDMLTLISFHFYLLKMMRGKLKWGQLSSQQKLKIALISYPSSRQSSSQKQLQQKSNVKRTFKGLATKFKRHTR
jgi:hypothetical protein